MATITNHISNAIFPKEHILAVKFLVGNEKNMGHRLIPKSQKVSKMFENPVKFYTMFENNIHATCK